MGGAEEALVQWRSTVVEHETAAQAYRTRDLCGSVLLLPCSPCFFPASAALFLSRQLPPLFSGVSLEITRKRGDR